MSLRLFHQQKSNILKCVTLFLSLLYLSGCGGGGETTPNNPANSPANNTSTARGTLIVPESNTGTRSITSIIAKNRSSNTRSTNCPAVPDGYSPMVGADLEFLDSSGNVIGSANSATNSCGFFEANIPSGTVQIRAKLSGYRDLVSDITHFTSQSNGVASTISTNAEYRFTQLAKIGDQQISFAVSDTVSGRPVLGLPASAFNARLDGQNATFQSLQSTVAMQEASSTVLTLDASGSMNNVNNSPYVDPLTQNTYTRFQITKLAAHLFLDKQKSSDELAVLIFDDNVSFLSGRNINTLFSNATDTDNPIDIEYPQSGFSSGDDAMFHFAVDAYNPYSTYWNWSSVSNPDPLHTRSPSSYNLGTIENHYPWGGQTALYDALYESVAKLCDRNSQQKFVVAMSDGGDNSSDKNSTDVIQVANSCNTPIYTVGFGSNSDANMETIAIKTGASFYRATDLDLTDIFQDIQANLQFQYVADINRRFGCGYSFTLSANINGQAVERTINGDTNVCRPSVSIDSPANGSSFQSNTGIQFTSSASDNGTLESFSWDFGNGDTSTEQNPLYQYRTAGNYTVTLTVTDNDGLSARDSIDLTINTSNVAMGELQGSVRDAVSDSPIAGVTINAYQNSTLKGTTTTDASGGYALTLPVATDYRLEFSHTNYQTAVMYNIIAVENITTYVEALLQINNNNATGQGGISGYITDAFNGNGLASVSVTLREGIGATSGNIVASDTTDSSGAYSISNLTPGHYTAEASKAGYTTAYFTVIVLGNTTKDNQNSSITPILGTDEIRVVLTWGATPQDLDAHLTGPIYNSVDRFHVFWSDKSYTDGGNEATLDADATRSSGPETITISNKTEGTYRYSVHDYTNRSSSNSLGLSQSGAAVKVYQGGALIASYNVPTGQAGTLWTVFELNGDTITPVNTMSNVTSSGEVRSIRPMGNNTATDAHLMWSLPEK